MENRIKELEALIVLLSRRIMHLEDVTKATGNKSGAIFDKQLLDKLKDESKKHLKNL